MKISKNWVKEYLNLDNITDDELFKQISFHICEIESYQKLVNATNLVIGKVIEYEMHPDSDHLHVCKVEIKPNEVSQIVCGAPNVKSGVKVIVALPGAVLPGNFKIKPSKIRGVESNGMLCSLQELGIEEKYVDERFKNGICLLDDDAIVGEDPLKYLGFDDIVIDLDLTSNRSDLLSIEGFAFDLGATLNQKVNTINPTFKVSKSKNPMNISVKTDKCLKYCTRYLKNVVIKPSPNWMKARLIASGIRPINNVVDITNYVLMELGQPLHAFDADLLGDTIEVRTAYNNEKLVTLDNIERDLNEDDIVITDGKKAICVAGVMGGLSTEVLPTTKNIVLEAAYFDPLSIRKTSAKLGLKSESSIRFERKVDYYRVERALDYAASLMQNLAECEVLDGVCKDVRQTIDVKTVDVTSKKINSILGTDISDSEMKSIFDRLAYSYTINGDVYHITIPSRRMDLEPSIQDITEDVSRIYGYDNIPTTLAETSDKGYLTYSQKRIRLIRQILASMGLNEVISYSLINKKDLNLYTNNQDEPIEVMMPMTEDRAVMRKSLLNGLIDAVKYNKARKIDNLALFEIGKTYSMKSETTKLAIAMSGIFNSLLWNGEKQNANFYLLKGILDDLFAKLNVSVKYKPYQDIKSFHPGRCAAIIHNDKIIGVIGQMHPKFSKEMDISTTIALEIDLEDIINEENKFEYKPINKFPSISRDLAIVCKKDILADDILSLIKQTGKKILTGIELFDVYTGVNVSDDEKSLAVKLTFEDNSKTLEASDVDKIVKSILNRLDYVYKAKIRE